MVYPANMANLVRSPIFRLLALVAAVALSAGTAAAEEPGPSISSGPFDYVDEGFIDFEGHFAMLAELQDKSLLSSTYGYGLRGGYRWGRFGLYAQAEQNIWLAREDGQTKTQSAVNLGIGGDVLYGQRFMRTSVTLGPSILATKTELDPAGSVGIFLDVRPMGLRWKVLDTMTLCLDPLTFSVVMPVFEGIPLVRIQYRTAFFIEVTL